MIESRLIASSEVDVLDIRYEGSKVLFSHPTHLVSDLLDKLQSALSNSRQLSSDECKQLFDEGIDCELLELGNSEWQTGKIRVCLEFIPDQEEASLEEIVEPENSIGFPLDEIRQTLNGASSIDG